MARSAKSFDCVHCGEPVALGAESCPHCGSDRTTGWSDDAGWAHTVDGEDDDDAPSVVWPRYLLRGVAVVVLVAIVAAEGMVAGLAFTGVVVAAALLYGWSTRGQGRRTSPSSREQRAYETLLERCALDEERAARMIDGERDRRPQDSKLQWIESALARLARDRR